MEWGMCSEVRPQFGHTAGAGDGGRHHAPDDIEKKA